MKYVLVLLTMLLANTAIANEIKDYSCEAVSYRFSELYELARVGGDEHDAMVYIIKNINNSPKVDFNVIKTLMEELLFDGPETRVSSTTHAIATAHHICYKNLSREDLYPSNILEEMYNEDIYKVFDDLIENGVKNVHP